MAHHLNSHSPLFVFSSTVVAGEQIGRTIGFPTANCADTPTEQELQPGVYVGTVQIAHNKTQYTGLIYFGPRLLFGEVHNNFEVFLFDFAGDLYGQSLTTQLLHFLRAPIPFVSLAALKEQLVIDQQNALSWLTAHKGESL